MLDLKEIRRDPEAARTALARRRADDRLDEVLRLDARRRELLPAEEALRAEQNRASKAIGAAKQGGGDASAEIAAMQDVAARAKELSASRAEVDSELDRLLATLPNLPLESAPLEEEVVREWGAAGRSGRDHVDLLDGLVDMEAGARLSGSRFVYLRGPLVMLELALVRWSLEVLSGHGFEPVIPPVLVREEALFGTGFLPDTEQQIYSVPGDDLYLVGTSEVALASLHRDEILDVADLPRRYAGFSPCFRREAGAAGKDTRGHVPGSPVRQGRDVRVRGAGGSRGGARADPGYRGGSCSASSRSRTAWSTSRSGTWARRRRRSTTARRGCPARAATAS